MQVTPYEWFSIVLPHFILFSSRWCACLVLTQWKIVFLKNNHIWNKWSIRIFNKISIYKENIIPYLQNIIVSKFWNIPHCALPCSCSEPVHLKNEIMKPRKSGFKSKIRWVTSIPTCQRDPTWVQHTYVPSWLIAKVDLRFF